MKRITFLLGTVLLCFLSACDKVNDDYSNSVLSSSYACDTSLYITYEIDNVTYKYYQFNQIGSPSFSPKYIPDKMPEVYYFERNICFGNLVADPKQPFLYGANMVLKFWNTPSYDKAIFNAAMAHDPNTTNLSKNLQVNIDYKFLSPSKTPIFKDSIFKKGVFLDGYTQNVMSAFKYDLPSIMSFYSDNSYFKISRIKSVGKSYYLVTGDFETIGIDDKKDTINFKNGHFVFLTK